MHPIVNEAFHWYKPLVSTTGFTRNDSVDSPCKVRASGVQCAKINRLHVGLVQIGAVRRRLSPLAPSWTDVYGLLCTA
jgi:hypothetical protein